MSNLKVAIIGCGGIANAHAGAWINAGGGALAACADISAEALEKFGEKYGIPGRYENYVEMLERERADVVHVCTHHHLHAEMVIKAAEFKPRAIVCEKPIALSLGDADDMIGACSRNGVLFVVTHQRRLALTNELAKEALDAGEIGELKEIQCGLHPWSSLLIDGTHLLDLVFKFMDDSPARFVFGNVYSYSARRAWGHQNEDGAFGMVRFANGKAARFSTGGFVNPESMAHDMEYSLMPGVDGPAYYNLTLYGTKGFIEVLGDDGGGPPDKPMARAVGVNGERILLTAGEYLEAGKRWGFQKVVECLKQSLETGAPHPLDAKYSRNPLEVITAMGISARDRSPVYLPLNIRDNPLLPYIDGEAERRKGKPL